MTPRNKLADATRSQGLYRLCIRRLVQDFGNVVTAARMEGHNPREVRRAMNVLALALPHYGYAVETVRGRGGGYRLKTIEVRA
jgi:hypothetical protein